MKTSDSLLVYRMPLYVWKGFWRGRLSWMNREFRNERKKTTTWQQAKHAKKICLPSTAATHNCSFGQNPTHSSLQSTFRLIDTKLNKTGPTYSSQASLKLPTPATLICLQVLSFTLVHSLCIPYVHTKIYGQRAFSYSASTLWNNLLQLDQPQIPLLRSNLP